MTIKWPAFSNLFIRVWSSIFVSSSTFFLKTGFKSERKQTEDCRKVGTCSQLALFHHLQLSCSPCMEWSSRNELRGTTRRSELQTLHALGTVCFPDAGHRLSPAPRIFWTTPDKLYLISHLKQNHVKIGFSSKRKFVACVPCGLSSNNTTQNNTAERKPTLSHVRGWIK